MSKIKVKNFLAGIAAFAMVGAAIPSDSFKSVFNSDFYDYEVSAAESTLTVRCGFSAVTEGSLDAGTKVAFLPTSLGATLSESDCLFNLPNGSAILETTDEENTSINHTGGEPFNNYVNVLQKASA